MFMKRTSKNPRPKIKGESPKPKVNEAIVIRGHDIKPPILVNFAKIVSKSHLETDWELGNLKTKRSPIIHQTKHTWKNI